MTGAPQPLTDALNNLQADADDAAAKTAALSQAQANLAAAQAAAANAQHDLAAARAKEAADLAALKGQLDSTYGAPPA